MTTVVLGWDGLDARLVDDYGLGGAFGNECRRLETITNGSLGKPHTFELWPTMITGVDPGDHGLHAEDYLAGGSWSSPLLNLAASVSKYTVPEAWRWRVGRWIRGRGATFDFESLDYYRDRGIPTVFDGRTAFPLAIPNARSNHDDALGMTMDRGAYLADFLDIGTDDGGRTIHTPTVPERTLSIRLEADVGKKLAAARAAHRQGYDIIWVWLAYVDTLGHVAPAIDDSDGWVRDAYDTAAAWTDWVRSWTSPDDTLICVSDHGLRAGEHTGDAFIGSWPGDAARASAHVRDVAAAVDSRTPESTQLPPSDGGPADAAAFETVEGRLEALGYV